MTIGNDAAGCEQCRGFETILGTLSRKGIALHDLHIARAHEQQTKHYDEDAGKREKGCV